MTVQNRPATEAVSRPTSSATAPRGPGLGPSAMAARPTSDAPSPSRFQRVATVGSRQGPRARQRQPWGAVVSRTSAAAEAGGPPALPCRFGLLAGQTTPEVVASPSPSAGAQAAGPEGRQRCHWPGFVPRLASPVVPRRPLDCPVTQARSSLRSGTGYWPTPSRTARPRPWTRPSCTGGTPGCSRRSPRRARPKAARMPRRHHRARPAR